MKVIKNINVHGEGYFLDIRSGEDIGFIAVDGEDNVTLVCNPNDFLSKKDIQKIISEYVT